MSMHKDDYVNTAKSGWDKAMTFFNEHRKFTLGLVAVLVGIAVGAWFF